MNMDEEGNSLTLFSLQYVIDITLGDATVTQPEHTVSYS